MIKLRLGKSKATGIGMKRKSPEKQAIECKKEDIQKRNPTVFRRLKMVSPKQAQRTADLNKKRKRMVLEMELHDGHASCMKCGKIQVDGGMKLVVDHVQTRNEKDADRYENLGLLCPLDNSKKGSIREEYRPTWFIARMKKLDEERRSTDILSEPSLGKSW